MKLMRCAIYTRKSTEEGLEQAFNSLHAQRDACEAYVTSQKALGWKAMPTLYDDGGHSGGNMKRPALERLLDDIRKNRVDVVVVYKVDRLTRALADFARIVDVFDAHNVSFVSVTQAFNTTSSMGRLTLNVLLSFAQFEREVTSERIRDKIAASKAKGMWMGGYPPLGYNAHERSLIVVPAEAQTVRLIFEQYVALGSVRALAIALETVGVRSKQHRSAAGDVRGGTPFSRGALFHLLKNRIYLGEIVHRERAYPGRHAPIVPPALFDRAQHLLAENRRHRGTQRLDPAPLSELVFDAADSPMMPVHAYGRSGRRYRYYVSKPAAGAAVTGYVRRVSAVVLEELVLDRARCLLRLGSGNWVDIRSSLMRVDVSSSEVCLHFKAGDLADPSLDEIGREMLPSGALLVRVRACLGPRKGSTRIRAPATRLTRSYFDQPLIAALKRAHRELAAHGVNDPAHAGLTARGIDNQYLRRIVRLAFLAPDIQHAILTGRQPAAVTLKRLISSNLPLDWDAQRKQLAFY